MNDVAGSLAVLGLLANRELVTVSRLAADAAVAPDLPARLELARLAGVAAQRLARLGERATELGAEPADVVAPFVDTYVDADARTPAGTWWERLLKAYVANGVADDVARILAGRVDAGTRAVMTAALDDDGHEAFVVARLSAAIDGDPVLASRLALWGRRVVGEALGVVQRVAAEHDDVRGLLEQALPGDGEFQQRLFGALTGEHTRRMERLGLTA